MQGDPRGDARADAGSLPESHGVRVAAHVRCARRKTRTPSRRKATTQPGLRSSRAARARTTSGCRVRIGEPGRTIHGSPRSITTHVARPSTGTLYTYCRLERCAPAVFDAVTGAPGGTRAIASRSAATLVSGRGSRPPSGVAPTARAHGPTTSASDAEQRRAPQPRPAPASSGSERPRTPSPRSGTGSPRRRCGSAGRSST